MQSLWKLFLIGLLFLSGCSLKTEKVQVALKTPVVKANDLGFLKKGFGYRELIIYNSLKPIKIVIKNSSVCVQDRCFSKRAFIKKLGNYPSNLLDNILDKKPLKFLGKIIEQKDGFIQKKGKTLYIVTKRKVFFRDKKIIIMIKDLDD